MAVRIIIDSNENEQDAYWDASEKREVFSLNIMPGAGDAVEITFTSEFTFGDHVFKAGHKLNAIVLSIDYTLLCVVVPLKMKECSYEDMIPVTMYLSPDCGFDIRLVNTYTFNEEVNDDDD